METTFRRPPNQRPNESAVEWWIRQAEGQISLERLVNLWKSRFGEIEGKDEAVEIERAIEDSDNYQVFDGMASDFRH